MEKRYGGWKEQKNNKKKTQKGRETEKDKKVSSMYIYNHGRKHNRVRPTSVRIFYIVNTQQWNRLVNIIVSSCT